MGGLRGKREEGIWRGEWLRGVSNQDEEDEEEEEEDVPKTLCKC